MPEHDDSAQSLPVPESNAASDAEAMPARPRRTRARRGETLLPSEPKAARPTRRRTGARTTTRATELTAAPTDNGATVALAPESANGVGSGDELAATPATARRTRRRTATTTAAPAADPAAAPAPTRTRRARAAAPALAVVEASPPIAGDGADAAAATEAAKKEAPAGVGRRRRAEAASSDATTAANPSAVAPSPTAPDAAPVEATVPRRRGRRTAKAPAATDNAAVASAPGDGDAAAASAPVDTSSELALAPVSDETADTVGSLAPGAEPSAPALPEAPSPHDGASLQVAGDQNERNAPTLGPGEAAVERERAPRGRGPWRPRGYAPAREPRDDGRLAEGAERPAGSGPRRERPGFGEGGGASDERGLRAAERPGQRTESGFARGPRARYRSDGSDRPDEGWRPEGGRAGRERPGAYRPSGRAEAERGGWRGRGAPRPGGYGQPGNVREPEPDRQRRGPIVDPKRRPGPDEAPPRPPRPGRGGAAVGTISKLAADYGFLRDGAGRTRFFHRTAVAGAFESLRVGQSVQYEPQDLPKGLRALNVRPAGAAPMGGQGRPARERAEQPPYGRSGQAPRPGQYGQRGAGGVPRGGQQYGQRRAGSGGAVGGTRRAADGRPASGGSGWRSSLSPFRNDPPAAPPRRRPR